MLARENLNWKAPTLSCEVLSKKLRPDFEQAILVRSWPRCAGPALRICDRRDKALSGERASMSEMDWRSAAALAPAAQISEMVPSTVGTAASSGCGWESAVKQIPA